MSEDFRPPTCRLDPEIDLVEEAPPPSGDVDASEPTDEEAFESLSADDRAMAESSLAEFREEAMALPAGEIKPLRSPATRAARNARTGQTNVLKHRARLRKELPYLEHDRLERVLRVALAVVFAASIAARQVKPAPTTRPKMKRVYHLRRLMLNSLRAVADKDVPAEEKVVSHEEVNAINAGQGFRDALGDLATLVHIFLTRAAALKGQTPVEAKDIEEARALVEELAPNFDPSGTGLAKEEPTYDEATDLRDRLWTMLQRDFEELVKAGTYLWGQQVTRHVPPLLSGARRAAKKADPSGSDE